MNARQAAAELRRRIPKLKELHSKAMDEIASYGMKQAIKRSSGPYSMADLRKRDHPYAKRHGSPKLDPSRINVQSGAFRESWYAVRTPKGRAIINENKVADYLVLGTETMFARPIDKAIEGDIVDRAKFIYAYTLEKIR